MNVKVEITRPAVGSRVGSPQIAPPLAPIKVWAALGGAFVALELYVWARWIFSGNFRPVSTGVDDVPTYMVIACRFNEVLGVGSFLFIMYRFVLRPWRRERRVPLVGVVALASLTMLWQDLGASWAANGVIYNAAFWNHGSWYNFVPGWIAPRGQFHPEPHALMLIYPLFFAGGTMLFLWCMRKTRARFPGWGPVKLCGPVLLVSAVLDIVAEAAWLRTGAYAYPGTPPAVTLFAGHYYQFPVYEVIFWAFAWAVPAIVLYFCDDRGHSLVERGLDRLRLKEGGRLAVRILALGALFNVAFLLYNGLWGLMSMQPASTWPKDIIKRSYLSGHLCGDETTYACPGAGLPLPRGDGSHIDPQGRLVPKSGADYN